MSMIDWLYQAFLSLLSWYQGNFILIPNHFFLLNQEKESEGNEMGNEMLIYLFLD